MASYNNNVPRLKDRDIFKFFDEAGKIISTPHFSITEVGGRNTEYQVGSANDASAAYLKASDLFTVHAGYCNAQGISLHLSRDASEPFVDKLQLSVDDNNRPPDEIVRALNRLISETFNNGTQPPLGILGSPKAATELIRSHQQMLGQLQSTATSVTEQLVSARLHLEEEFAERNSKLEEEYQARQTQSEATMEELKRSIIEREKELQQRSEALDNRDHIHARRALNTHITETIKSRLSGSLVPTRVSILGQLVLILSLLGSFFLGAISWYSLLEYGTLVERARIATTQVQTAEIVATAAQQFSVAAYFLLARGFLAGVGAVAFLLYAIAWLKSQYRDHLRAHQNLERYSIDINRASWAVETIMEAQRDNGVIPDILVAGVTKNLFEIDAAPSKSKSSDGLSELLRASAKATISPNGAEFELNSRGAKKLASELD